MVKTPRNRLQLGLTAAGLCVGTLGVLLFLTAGRWDLPWFWGYLGLYAVFCLMAPFLMDPGLIKERIRPGPNARDKLTVVLGKILGLAHYAIAGLDVGRFRWSGDLPLGLQVVAFALVALTGSVTMWAMAVNPFFSTVVRIQEERGHRLITTGPYRIVRHPGYAVIFIMLAASGGALGSWWSMIPMGGFALLLARRAFLEDRFLLDHLEGYADYARRVPYRLIPGIW